MSITRTPQVAVIDKVSIILILLPEPTTAALGIAVMARPRGNSNQVAAASCAFTRLFFSLLQPFYSFQAQPVLMGSSMRMTMCI